MTGRCTAAVACVALAAGACGSSARPSPHEDRADASPPVVDPTAVVFDTAVLHRIDIRVDPAYFDQLEWYRDERVPCSITYDGHRLDDVGIRQKRGGGSWSWLGGKPGFSIKFDELVPDQDLFGMNKIVLNNAVQDSSLLGEHLAYEVFRRAGMPAPRTAHAIVSLNGWTYGVYVVKEPINKQFLARNYGAANKQGNLYEGVCCADFVFNVPLMDLKNEHEEGRRRDGLYALAETIRVAGDDELAARLGDQLAFDEFLTYYAIEALIDSPDTYSRNANNYYLFHHPDGRFRVLPHGMDKVLSDALDPDNHYEPLAHPHGHLSARARGVPELDRRWRERLVSIAADVWDAPALLERIDAVAAILRGSTSTDERVIADVAVFEATVGLVRDVVARRKAMTRLEEASCGDRELQGAEECDDGNPASNDGCSAECFIEHCGDDIWQPGIGEVCDGEGCNLTCTGASECGNGSVEAGEQCDYGVMSPYDDCTNDCQWMWCGDGIVQPQIGEACDGTGCKRNCSGPAVCGDGLLDWGEDCDDGNLEPEDGCAPGCRFEDCVAVSGDGMAATVCATPRPFLAAEKTCSVEARFLATPVSADDTAWLAGQILGQGGSSAWLGAYRDETGQWRAAVGGPLAYTAWAPGHPSAAATHRCAILDAHTALWSSADCALAQAGSLCRTPGSGAAPARSRRGAWARPGMPPAAQAQRRRAGKR